MYSTLSRKKRQAVSSVVSTMEQNSFCSFRNCFFSFRRKDEQFSLHRPTLTSFHVHRFHCLFLCLKFCTLHRLTLTSREMYLLLQHQCCKLQHQCSVTSSVCHIVTGRFFRGFMCFFLVGTEIETYRLYIVGGKEQKPAAYIYITKSNV